MKHLMISAKIFLFFTLLAGVVYPLLVTGIAKAGFAEKASGQIVEQIAGQMADAGRAPLNLPIGAKQIAQKFATDFYFWGRPSAIDYNPLPSGGSNFGPTSEALKKAVDERAALVRKAHGLPASAEVPQDLILASASGLDPDISPAAAYFQVDRVARARGLNAEQTLKLKDLVARHVEHPDLGFIGDPRVNVLLLNLALNQQTSTPSLPPPTPTPTAIPVPAPAPPPNPTP